jgi:hypothetical protein
VFFYFVSAFFKNRKTTSVFVPMATVATRSRKRKGKDTTQRQDGEEEGKEERAKEAKIGQGLEVTEVKMEPKQFADFVLTVGGTNAEPVEVRRYYLHRAILATGSTVFAALFSSGLFFVVFLLFPFWLCAPAPLVLFFDGM